MFDITIKKSLSFLLFSFFVLLSCSSKEIKTPFFTMELNDKIDISDEKFYLYINYENDDELLISGSYIVSYANEKIWMQIIIKLDKENNEYLKQLIQSRKVILQSVSIGPQLSKPFKIYESKEIDITECICDVGNGWCSDKFDFYVNTKNSTKGITFLNISFGNIYSTYIEKDGYISPWNKEKVKEYKDQSNPGIQFYYMMEESIKTIKLNKVQKKNLEAVEFSEVE